MKLIRTNYRIKPKNFSWEREDNFLFVQKLKFIQLKFFCVICRMFSVFRFSHMKQMSWERIFLYFTQYLIDIFVNEFEQLSEQFNAAKLNVDCFVLVRSNVFFWCFDFFLLTSHSNSNSMCFKTWSASVIVFVALAKSKLN